MAQGPLVQRRGGGKTVATGRMTVEYLAPTALTGDAIGIYLLTLSARSPGASPHYHQRMSETFHIQSGVLTLLLDDTVIEAGPGDFILVPPGVVHAFANRGGETAVFTLTFTPGLAREGFFEGLAALVDSDPETAATGRSAVMAAYDQVPVDGVAIWNPA